jgi:hypothetical protein
MDMDMDTEVGKVTLKRNAGEASNDDFYFKKSYVD